MHIIRSFFSAFLMYSAIPVPQVEWKEENRRYALCFFPFVGIIIGGLATLWYCFCIKFSVGNLLFSAVMTAIPILITGGIHLDGFCDVCDAKACMGTKEKMLEVMSDPHIGAFAAIKLAVYLLVQTAVFSQIKRVEIMLICALGFVLSRALSGLAAVTFRCAKSGGTLQKFSAPAQKKITVFAEIIFIAISVFLMIFFDGLCGTFGVLGGLASFAYYRLFSYKKFGGITGDLAGYFLQICELSITVFTVLSDVISEAVL